MKLAPHVIEALAHDRADLLSDAERAEVDALRESDGETLERVIASARESSHAFTRALPRAVDALSSENHERAKSSTQFGGATLKLNNV